MIMAVGVVVGIVEAEGGKEEDIKIIDTRGVTKIIEGIGSILIIITTTHGSAVDMITMITEIIMVVVDIVMNIIAEDHPRIEEEEGAEDGMKIGDGIIAIVINKIIMTEMRDEEIKIQIVMCLWQNLCQRLLKSIKQLRRLMLQTSQK